MGLTSDWRGGADVRTSFPEEVVTDLRAEKWVGINQAKGVCVWMSVCVCVHMYVYECIVGKTETSMCKGPEVKENTGSTGMRSQ